MIVNLVQPLSTVKRLYLLYATQYSIKLLQRVTWVFYDLIFSFVLQFRLTDVVNAFSNCHSHFKTIQKGKKVFHYYLIKQTNNILVIARLKGARKRRMGFYCKQQQNDDMGLEDPYTPEHVTQQQIVTLFARRIRKQCISK